MLVYEAKIVDWSDFGKEVYVRLNFSADAAWIQAGEVLAELTSPKAAQEKAPYMSQKRYANAFELTVTERVVF